MTKEELFVRVKSDIDVMVNGNEFDVRHFFGITAFNSYPKSDKEQIATLFEELSNDEFKDQIIVVKENSNLQLQVYKKIAEKKINEPKNVFPGEPVTIKKGTRGNA